MVAKPLWARSRITLAVLAMTMAIQSGAMAGEPARSMPQDAAVAPGSPDTPGRPVAPVVHVRGLKDGAVDAGRMLRDGMRLSPTLRSLVEALEKSDVIVHIELKAGVPGGTGLTRWISKAGGYRHLLVSIEMRNSTYERYGWLGHELRHALEVAEAPEVSDVAGLELLYTRTGKRTANGWFETDAAVEAGVAVSAEVRGIRGKR